MNAPVKLLPVDEVRLGGPLARLSIQRVDGIRGVPPVPGNAERMAVLRPFLPVKFGNARFWRSEHERYAAEACADAEPELF